MYRRVVDGYGEYDYATFNDNFQQQNGTVLAYWQNEVDKYYVINDRCTTSHRHRLKRQLLGPRLRLRLSLIIAYLLLFLKSKQISEVVRRGLAFPTLGVFDKTPYIYIYTPSVNDLNRWQKALRNVLNPNVNSPAGSPWSQTVNDPGDPAFLALDGGGIRG